MRKINDFTLKWALSIFAYQCLYYDLQNSSIITLLFPSPANGNILIELRKIVNMSSTVLLNSQTILCSNTGNVRLKASKDYFGVFNGSKIFVFNYCQNCPPLWTMSASNIFNFDFCGPWFLYSSMGVIYQHFVNNGTFISSLQTAYPTPRFKVL